MRKIVKLRGGQLASFQVLGQGIPALMIPGGRGISASYLADDAELFPYVLRSYLVDPPGSGMSTPPEDPAEYSPCDLARFYEEARKALGLSRVVLLGHSSGASAALAYAAMYPQSTAACIAVAPLGIGVDPDDSATDGIAVMAERHSAASQYGEGRLIVDERDKRVRAAAQAAAVKQARAGDRGREADLRPLLSRIRRPALVLAGELDPVFGPAQARLAARAVLGAHLVVLPDCGHLPALDAPDAYREVVLDFLRNSY
jgi:pimeloyl-ACP methyl ester carboxylesterase